MCGGWAWSGQPVIVEELLFEPVHGLTDQSLHSRMVAETTNGDGFGLGGDGAGEGPGTYHSVSPAWGDANLRDLAAHIETHLLIAHVRATSGTAIQQTNCHPFRHGKWLFVHNGVVAVAALERTLGLVEATAVRHGIEGAVQASIGVTDGERLWAFRYATEGEPRTLFVSSEAETIRHMYPDDARLRRVHDEDRVVVSEPMSELPGLWHEIPASTLLIVQPGPDEQRPFHPHFEPAAGNGVPAAS